jgi:hypothetical protein
MALLVGVSALCLPAQLPSSAHILPASPWALTSPIHTRRTAVRCSPVQLTAGKPPCKRSLRVLCGAFVASIFLSATLSGISALSLQASAGLLTGMLAKELWRRSRTELQIDDTALMLASTRLPLTLEQRRLNIDQAGTLQDVARSQRTFSRSGSKDESGLKADAECVAVVQANASLRSASE